MERSQFQQYNDGVVIICQEKEKKTDFNARQNPSSKKDLKEVVKLNYGMMSIRNQDLDFAQQSGFELSLKIRTRKFNNLTSKHVAIIDNCLYGIRHIDKDKTNLYLYLDGGNQSFA